MQKCKTKKQAFLQKCKTKKQVFLQKCKTKKFGYRLAVLMAGAVFVSKNNHIATFMPK